MEGLLEIGGVWLARVYSLYGMVLLILSFTFVNLALLALAIWAIPGRAHGQQSRSYAPAFARRWAWLTLEIAFGLLNPVLYLAILAPALPGLRPEGGWWLTPLAIGAWILLAAFWTLRLLGGALDGRSRGVRAGVQALLLTSLLCVLLYAVKDTWLLVQQGVNSPLRLVANFLRLCPLYLIPVVVLWGYLQSAFRLEAEDWQRLFLLNGRPARVSVGVVAGLALITVLVAAQRRSDSAARAIVSGHRNSIRAAAVNYDVDPRLVASIVYVTHRDQLSPFRGALERLVITVWAQNMRGYFGLRPPERIEVNGTDENPLLNRALDISVGLAQIKPRTAQTASVLAMGLTPDDLPKPAFFSYRDVEPAGEAWIVPAAAGTPDPSPIPFPADRQVVAEALLDASSNLATCALILSLYQRQWEAASKNWSIRARPDILATLYQIGFARSKPHRAPRSNAFGRRVREVYEQPWLSELLAASN